MKLFKINKNDSLGLTLPKPICKGFGWEQGDLLGFKIINEGTLGIYKKKKK